MNHVHVIRASENYKKEINFGQVIINKYYIRLLDF